MFELTGSLGCAIRISSVVEVFLLLLCAFPQDGNAAIWPIPTGTEVISGTRFVSKSFNGKMKRYIGGSKLGSGDQKEGQGPLFQLSDGATLENVIIGRPGADGIHCRGTCTLRNVWWEDVGEDAATFKRGASNSVMTVDGGGARKASDKVFQHNAPGTMIIKNFQFEDCVKLYQSCGNCVNQYKRNVIMQNITVTTPVNRIVMINENYGDTARLSNVNIYDDSQKKVIICQRVLGNNKQKSNVRTGSGPDGKHCFYKPSDVIYH